MFCSKSEFMFAAHGLPRFGKDAIHTFLSSHRDAYKYLHDQSVRLINEGMTPSDIAEVLDLPPVLSKQWFNRGYYGTMSHNTKAVYQRFRLLNNDRYNYRCFVWCCALTLTQGTWAGSTATLRT